MFLLNSFFVMRRLFFSLVFVCLLFAGVSAYAQSEAGSGKEETVVLGPLEVSELLNSRGFLYTQELHSDYIAYFCNLSDFDSHLLFYFSSSGNGVVVLSVDDKDFVSRITRFSAESLDLFLLAVSEAEYERDVLALAYSNFPAPMFLHLYRGWVNIFSRVL